MRVALLTYSTRPRGSVVHALALADALAALGEQVTVVGLGRSGDTSFYRPLDPRVTPVVVPLQDVPGEEPPARVRRNAAAMAGAVDPDGFDVVHAQDWLGATAVPGCVRTVHHLDVLADPRLQAHHDEAVRRPYALVCVSEHVAEEVRRAFGREADVVPNGVDAERFATVDLAARAEVRARLAGAPLVVTLGGIEPRKGSEELVEAVALLGPGAVLAVGGGESAWDHSAFRDRVLRLSEQRGVDLRLLGPLPEAAVAPLVAAADVFALPSRQEGFGMAALEALAAGVPVVLRDLPVFREVFGDTVRYGTDPASLAAAMAAPALDPAPGLALARAHTWARAAAAHQVLYTRLQHTRTTA